MTVRNARFRRKLARTASLAAILVGWNGLGRGAIAGTVSTDGTLGHAGATLAGPNYRIGPGLGRTVGTNLFQSFKQFSLAPGDTAIFTGPTSGQPITNVLARVTGGQSSMIGGAIECTIPNANFYLINPSGVIFGPTAQLNVQASFAVTTANLIHLGAGTNGTFRATRPSASLLTTAAPAAFGFLQHRPAPVTVLAPANSASGSSTGATLQVNDGANALSIVAGPVTAYGGGTGGLLAYGGAVNIVGVGSRGEVAFNAADPSSTIALHGFSRLASVLLDGENVAVDDQDPNNSIASINGAGQITIRSANLNITDNTILSSQEFGAFNGGNIDLGATRNLTVNGGATVFTQTLGTGNCGGVRLTGGSVDISDNGTNVYTSTGPLTPAGGPTDGNCGSVTITAKSLTVENEAQVNTYANDGGGTAGGIGVNARSVTINGDQVLNFTGYTGLFTDNVSTDIGAITIKSSRLSLVGEGEIVATTLGSAPSGNIAIRSDRLILNGNGLNSDEAFPTSIVTQNGLGPTGSGAAGNITIQGNELQVLNTAFIAAETTGSGNAGQMDIREASILLDGTGPDTEPDPFTGLTVNTANSNFGEGTNVATGNGGGITIHTGSLRILRGAQISAKTTSLGDGGTIDIHAGQLFMRGGAAYPGGPDLGTGIDAVTFDGGLHEGSGTGNGGNIAVAAGTLLATDGAFISASTTPTEMSSPGFIVSPGTGNAGSVTVTVAQQAQLADGGQISANAPLSNAGSVEFQAGGSINLRDGTILTNADGSGGNINIKTPNLLYLLHGTISTNAGFIGIPKAANGGNITIDPAGVVFRGDSDVGANAIFGMGGNIAIRADVYQKSPTSAVTATGETAGLAGRISVTGSDQDLVSSLTQLPGTLALPPQLQDRCGAVALAGSSFTAAVLGAPPPEPGGWSASLGDDAPPAGAAGAAGPDAPVLRQAAQLQAHGDYSAADRLLSQALKTVRSANDRPRIVALLDARAAVNTLGGWFVAADRDLDEAYALAEKDPDHNALAAILNDRGNLELSQQQYAAAMADYRAGLALVGRAADATGAQLAAKLEVNGALAAVCAGDLATARAANAQALERLSHLPDSRTKAFLYVTAGNTARQISDLGSARRAFAEAIGISQFLGDRQLESAATGLWGNLEEVEGQYGIALDLTRRAILAAQRDPYTLYKWEWQRARILADSGQSGESLASRRRAVAELTPEVRGGLSSPGGNRVTPFDFRRDVGPLLFQTADVLLRNAASESDAQRQQALLVEARDVIELLKSAEVQDYLRDPCVPPLRSIGALAPRTAVIYIVPLSDRTELLVELSDGLHQITAPINSSRLADQVRALRVDLEDRTSNRYRRPASLLYQALIAPLEPLLAAHGTQTLVFVPDGALRTIPMGSLCFGPHSEHFLIEKYAVAVSPGLRLMDHKVAAAPGATLVAGLSEARPGFAPLAYVPKEISEVAQLYPGKTLLDQDFRLEALRESLVGPAGGGQYSMVHLATHGHFGASAADTFLLTYQGKLTLGELQAMIGPSRTSRRPVELLTLSACETAAGDDQAALGLAGIAVKSGARTAVATLWCVDDEASVDLIDDFYKEMRNHPTLSKAQAMQFAQLHLCNQPGFRHPYYWAPYLVIGNWL